MRQPIRQTATPAIGEDALDLREMFRAVWRNRWVIAALTGAQVLLAVYVAMTATPYYSASATVMLDIQENQVIDFQSVVDGLSSDYETINTEMEVMRSRNLLDRVVEKMRLEQDPEFNPDLLPEDTGWLSTAIAAAMDAVEKARAALSGPPEEKPVASPADYGIPLEDYTPEFIRRQTAIDLLDGALSVSNVESSYIFELGVTTEHPLKSAAIANAVAEQYILNQLEVKFEATSQATKWLSERVADLKTALEKAEGAVKDFSANASLISEEALSAQERQIKDMRARLGDMDANSRALETRLDLLDAAREADDFTAVADALNDRRLRELALDIAAQGEGDPDRRAALVALFDAQYAASRSRLEAEARRAEGQAALIRASVSDLEREVDAQSADLLQLQQLQREAEASRLIYEYFLSRMKETSVQQGIQQADARILSPAIAQTIPVEPRKRMIIAVALLGGLMLSTLAVLAATQLRTAIQSPEELETLTGEMVMGVIPAAPSRNRRALMEYMVKKPSSALAEAIRNLRTAILMSDLDRPPKVVMISSSTQGEGKTTTTLLLAQNSAMLGKKVLVIECDLRRNVFDKYFETGDKKRLMALLSGAASLEEVLVRDPNTGLDVIVGEESKINAADVFSSARFGEFMQEMRARYDHIFIDTPPVLVVPDARVISRHADAIIFAVKWNVTTRTMVATSLDLFRQVNARIAGLALTQANIRRMSRYGYYGYGYGYRRTQRYYRN